MALNLLRCGSAAHKSDTTAFFTEIAFQSFVWIRLKWSAGEDPHLSSQFLSFPHLSISNQLNSVWARDSTYTRSKAQSIFLNTSSYSQRHALWCALKSLYKKFKLDQIRTCQENSCAVLSFWHSDTEIRSVIKLVVWYEMVELNFNYIIIMNSAEIINMQKLWLSQKLGGWGRETTTKQTIVLWRQEMCSLAYSKSIV